MSIVIFNSTQTIRGAAANGTADISTLERNSVLLEYSLTYDNTFKEQHNVNLLGSVTYQNFVIKLFGGIVSNFPSDVFGYDVSESGPRLFKPLEMRISSWITLNRTIFLLNFEQWSGLKLVF